MGSYVILVGVYVQLLLVCTSLTFGQEVINPPQSTVVLLDHPAIFRCVIRDADFILWYVNGTSYNRVKDEVRDDMNLHHPGKDGDNELFTLTIPGKAKYNETEIQCAAGTNKNRSKIATLSVQGILESVGNVKIDGNRVSITLSWNAPFSLDVTDVDPDIWYTVIVYNMTDEENPTATILCTDYYNLTYIFSPDYPSPCHKYVFTIFPQNGAGLGKSSWNVTGYTIENKLKVDFAKAQIKDTVNGYEITLLFTGNVQDVCSYIPDSLFPEYHSADGHVVYTEALEANKKYLIDFSVVNAAESIPICISFSTFDVQNVMVQKLDEGIIQLTTELISGSKAKGCFVVVQCDESQPDYFRALLRRGDEMPKDVHIPSVKDSECSVIVYDIEEDDGLPNRIPAVILEDKIKVGAHVNDTKQKHNQRSLTMAEISREETGVKLVCKFADEYPEASCILIYRKYNTTILTVNKYNGSTVFPLIITVNDSATYTFSVFGMNGRTEMQPEPVKTVLILPWSARDDNNDLNIMRILVVVAVLLILAIIIVAIVVAYIMHKCGISKYSYCKNPTEVLKQVVCKK